MEDGLHSELHGDLTMNDLLENYAGARRALFSTFHIGGCQSCAYEIEDSLAEVCQKHDLSLEEALTCLRESREHDAEMLISVEEFSQHLKEPEKVTLLDIRTREEHESIKLPNTLIMTQELQTQLFSEKSEDDVIILMDHKGLSVLDQCAWFRGHGLKKTYGVEGGIDRYSQEIDSTVPRYRLEMD